MSELAKQAKKSEEEQQKEEITKLVSSILLSPEFKKKGKVSTNATASAATASSAESTSSPSLKLNHIIGKATHSKKF